ncbi:YaaW family protein, partial [Providencia stuartii]
VRGNKGVLYREILLDVCKKLKVNFNPKSDIETLEMNLLMTVMEKSLDKLSEEELRTLSHDLQLNLTNPTPQLVMIALQAAVRTSGFAALEIATVAAMSIIELLGGVATWGTIFVANRALSFLAGPIGLTLTSAWLIADIAGPAYRVTIPACIIVAYLRQKSLSPA